MSTDAPPARVVAVVPCFDVASTCAAVVTEVARHVDRVIAVDDGSRDGTGEALATAAAASAGRIQVLVHAQNEGKGVALLTAFRHALADAPFDVLVTIDGDGQHDPARIPAVAAACHAGAPLAIGTRTLFHSMPARSRFGNSLTTALLRLLRPRCPPDTQSGFRALSHPFVERVVREVPAGRYETEMGVLLLALDARARIATVPIPTLYVDRNAASHFRPLVDGLRVYRSLAGALVSRRRRGVRGPDGDRADR